MKTLCFVTSNKDKVDEAKKILGIPIEIVDIDIDEIQSMDLGKVVKHKAEEAYKIVKKPVFVDDVSFEVFAWNGFPGPFVKYLYQSGGHTYDLILKMLKGEKNRLVRIRADIGYHDGRRVYTMEGSFMGKIVARRGKNGWGFDPYVIPEGYKHTFGEMSEGLKNQISHRARALKKLKKLLNSQKD